LKIALQDSKQALTQLRQLWRKIKDVLDGGIPLVLEIKRESKTRQQEKLYHTYIGKASKQARHLGCKYNEEDWKRILVDAYLRDTNQSTGQLIPNLDGTGVIQLGLQTRDFKKHQASEFVSWLEAWCANNGVDVDG
jgi:hypothetical protein